VLGRLGAKEVADGTADGLLAPFRPGRFAERATRVMLERVYRNAASALLAVVYLRVVIGRRELHRRFSRVSETLTEAADRVWYATVKEG
jgi:hypothetical protein